MFCLVLLFCLKWVLSDSSSETILRNSLRKKKKNFALLLITEKNGNGSSRKMNRNKAPVQRANQSRQ